MRSTLDYPSFERSNAGQPHDLGVNGSFMVIRQLAQDVEKFGDFVSRAANTIKGRPGTPAGYSQEQLEQWVAAKLVGRWRDGTSLVRYPHRPGTGWNGELKRAPDNAFLLGKEDPAGHNCPFGAHIRRSNPRDSFLPGSQENIDINNRHRILRFGRSYLNSANAADSGLLFMCLNVDIERQFEFIQQTWAMKRLFHGLDGEVDSILGRGQLGGRLTIPTPAGPLTIEGMPSFVTTRAELTSSCRAAARYDIWRDCNTRCDCPPAPDHDRARGECWMEFSTSSGPMRLISLPPPRSAIRPGMPA